MHPSTSPPPLGTCSPLSERPEALVQAFGVEPFHTSDELFALGFAPDGMLWSVEGRGVLRHWDPAHRRQLAWHDLDDLADRWAFSPDCRLAASGSDEVSLWGVKNGEQKAVFTPPSWVTSLAFSADGNLLATGHDDGAVRLWDAEKLRMTLELRGHHRPVSALAFSPDGQGLASAGEDKAIQLWDLAAGKIVRTLLGHTDRIPALAWHPTRPRLYSAGWDTTARVWDTDTGEPVILLNSHAGQVFTLAISRDGALLACADSANAIRLWDLADNREARVWPEQPAEVRCLAFSPDGRQLVWGGADRVLHLRDVYQEPADDEATDPIEARSRLTVSPDGNRLFSLGTRTALRVWDVASGKPALNLKDAGPLRTFALSPDGTRVAASLEAVGSGQWAAGRQDKDPASQPSSLPTLGLWDAATGERKALLEGQAPPITSLAFSPNSRVLASAGYASEDVWLWDVSTGQPLLLIPNAVEGCSVESLAFHPQGAMLAVGGIDWMATGGSDGAVALWDHAQRRLVSLFGFGTRALAVHPSGQRLAAASLANTVQIWAIPGGNLLAEYKGHSDAVTCLAYSPDGRWLASGGDDHTVRVWDTVTDSLVAAAHLDTQVKSLCFSPDGVSLFTGNANTSCYQLSVPRLLAEGA